MSRPLEAIVALALAGGLHLAVFSVLPDGANTRAEKAKPELTVETLAPAEAKALLDAWSAAPSVSSAPRALATAEPDTALPVPQPPQAPRAQSLAALTAPGDRGDLPERPEAPTRVRITPGAIPSLTVPQETRAPQGIAAPLAPRPAARPGTIGGPSREAVPRAPAPGVTRPAQAPLARVVPLLEPDEDTLTRLRARATETPERPARPGLERPAAAPRSALPATGESPRQKTGRTEPSGVSAATVSSLRPKLRPKSLGNRVTTRPAPANIADSASAPTAQPGPDVATAKATWGAEIQSRIQINLRYPDDASGSGTVLVTLTVAPSGQLLDARISRSSGSAVFDEAALGAVRGAGHFAPAPEALEADNYRFNLPLTFRQ